jgi:ApbE superfamily uncharacterized protein (UPF0280 family)
MQMKTPDYQDKTYRHWIDSKDLADFMVTEKETDLYIRAASNLQRKARRIVLKYRAQLEQYIGKNPDFHTSLKPLYVPETAPLIVKAMAEAGTKANVGPMAAVAGAIAEFVGKELLEFTPEIIIENGGDIFMKVNTPRIIGIYAGNSPLTGKLGLEISPQETPLGICTSSGTVGHSLSFGNADAVVAVAQSATLADAAATAVCNLVKKPADINQAIEAAQRIGGLKGVVIIMGGDIGVWGSLKLCETAQS